VTSGKRSPVVAIDGPAGAGKSTAARMLAERLGFVLVDTGSLYRGTALAALRRGVSFDDGPGLGAMASTLSFRFERREGGEPRLYLDGDDVADAIRTADISTGASRVSRHPEVRAALLGLQRRLGEGGGVVLEGRDIGTVVFPDAEVKVFLTASVAERARRRVADLAQRGTSANIDETLEEIQRRDRMDEEREVAPLKPAPDALVLDTTVDDLTTVVDRLVAIVRSREP
jgi:CMP/dCMP kinase